MHGRSPAHVPRVAAGRPQLWPTRTRGLSWAVAAPPSGRHDVAILRGSAAGVVCGIIRRSATQPWDGARRVGSAGSLYRPLVCALAVMSAEWRGAGSLLHSGRKSFLPDYVHAPSPGRRDGSWGACRDNLAWLAGCVLSPRYSKMLANMQVRQG